VWTVMLPDTGAAIGVTALHRIDWRHRHAWIEITLGDRSSWGRGLGTEAVRACTEYGFVELGLEKILASVYSGNEASLRMLARVGYQPCGLLRRHCFLGGAWHDEWLGEVHHEAWAESQSA
jgi:RimJ/RimL family protein N-acetyltransferase